MAFCPICEASTIENFEEWDTEESMLYDAECPECGWRGNVRYVQTTLWDYRTDKELPTDEEELAKWREENAQYYSANTNSNGTPSQ